MAATLLEGTDGAYDVSADGQRFLTTVAGPGVSTAQLTVVRNWRAAFEK